MTILFQLLLKNMIPLYNERILYKSTLYSFKKALFIRCSECFLCNHFCGILNNAWFCCNINISGKYVAINQ